MGNSARTYPPDNRVIFTQDEWELEGEKREIAETGDVVVLPKNVPHIHPWNGGNKVLHCRIIIQLAIADMQLLLAPAGLFESMYALAQRGRGGKDRVVEG